MNNAERIRQEESAFASLENEIAELDKRLSMEHEILAEQNKRVNYLRRQRLTLAISAARIRDRIRVLLNNERTGR